MVELSDLADKGSHSLSILNSKIFFSQYAYCGSPPQKIHLFRAKEIMEIRKAKWQGLKNHLIDYTLQKWEEAMEKVATFIYEKHPKIGDIYDFLNPLPF